MDEYNFESKVLKVTLDVIYGPYILSTDNFNSDFDFVAPPDHSKLN